MLCGDRRVMADERHHPTNWPTGRSSLPPARRGPDLDGLPAGGLTGALGQAEAVLAVDRRAPPTSPLTRLEHGRQVVQRRITAQPGHHDETGSLCWLDKLSIGIASIDGHP